MAEQTGISWTHHTFNTWWGCVKISEACQFCYANREATRYGFDLWGPNSRRRFFGDKHWNEPRKWNAAAEAAGVRRRVFCASMADVFEMLPEGHPDRDAMAAARARLFDDLIPSTPWLDWLILTKRPQAMCAWSQQTPFPDNVIAMTTAENQQRYDERIGWLLRTRAERRGLSIEPLLGPVNLGLVGTVPSDISRNYRLLADMIGWVIVGGESGPKARPMNPAWVRSLRDECVDAGVPFHFKQWGEWAPSGAEVRNCSRDRIDVDGVTMSRVGKKAAGRLVGGKLWNEFPAAV